MPLNNYRNSPGSGLKVHIARIAVSILFLISFLESQTVIAQSSNLSDYVILAGDPTCSGSNCGLDMASDISIDNGIAGSYNNIEVENDLSHGGAIFSLQSLEFLRNIQITGNLYVANSNGALGNVLISGNNSAFGGNILVDGDIHIDNGSIAGQVTRPAGSSYSGPIPAGGEQISTPSFSNLPAFPAITNIPPSGTQDIRSTQSITPGSYDLMRLRDGKTVTFSGTGDYIFEKIYNSGSYNTFIIDFQNDPNGVIRILVHDDVNLGEMKVQLINGADPSRIYLETHDNTNGRAFRINGADFGNGEHSTWYGTVYAPFESMIIGNNQPLDFTGVLLSPYKIEIKDDVNITFAPFGTCVPSTFNLQVDESDTIGCNITSISLSASASNGNFSWTTNEGNILSGANTANPVVNAAGWYFVSVSENGCSATDSILVVVDDCIDPYYPAPVSGKTDKPTGSELSQLAENSNFQDTGQVVYQISNDSVFIEIIANAGQYQTLLNLLQTAPYGLSKIIDNGPNSLIISGLYPIQNLPKLDSLPQLINYVRPLIRALNSRGVALSQGDRALNAPFVRGGFDVNGEGVKIGVLSDSYNKLPGNPAATDISNEDLPGPGNPINSTAVNVLQDYPFGGGTDEGRAMLQIIHDIAPKAELAFRSGYISAGDFAQGILQLAADGCDIIVDDITYITEPYLSDGVVSQAVNSVVAQGVTYFSSAGNFGRNSYGATFNPAAAPGDIVGSAHDFGGGDIYQSVSLQPGNYLMVLQWQDSIYSIGQTATGTTNDLDFYLTDDQGNTLFGFNRNNIGGDPLEIMPFTVKEATQSNILVVRAAGTDNVPFKLVIFRGALSFNEYNTGTSTVVGHPNSEGAIAVGAARYDQTPAFGVDPPVVESFSSEGGTPVGGIVRNKPEICAVNGVNTTVDLGAGDYEGDGLPNFFGTSAAAPHAAAVAGLIQSAKLKFEGSTVSPQEMRNILIGSAIDMGDPGFDFATGNGLIQADLSLLTIASPNPVVYSITLLDTTRTPGVDTVLVRINGDFFTGDTKILLRNDTLSSSTISSTSIETEVPPFTGNPPITAYIDPISSSGLDGGGSNDSLFFLNQIQKQEILVVMNDQTKFYGERIPQLTYQVLVDSVPLSATGLTLSDIGLDNMNITTTANSLSNVGIYLIRATQRSLDPADAFDAGLLDLYTWQFIDAQLIVEKMPLTISVKDTTLPYGVLISEFDFQYDYADSLIDPADSLAIYDSIFVNHTTSIADVLVLVNAEAKGEYLARGRAIVNADVEKRTYMASSRAIVNARPFANPLSSISGLPDTTLIVDLSAESIFDYADNPDTVTLSNAFTAEGSNKEYQASSRAIVNALDFAMGSVIINAVDENGTKYQASSRAIVNALPLVNASVGSDGQYLARGRAIVNDYPIVNGQPVNQDSSEIVFILDEADVDTALTDSIFPFFPANVVLGNQVGNHAIVPAALYNPNFNISYELGTLTVIPDTLYLQADTITSTYGDSINFTYITSGYEYVDADSTVIKGPPTYSLIDSSGTPVQGNKINVGTYTIVPDNLDLGDTTNYIASYSNGQLTVLPANLLVGADSSSSVYGESLSIPVSISGFKYDDDSISNVLAGPAFDILDAANSIYSDPEPEVGNYTVQLKDLQLLNPANYVIQYGSAPLSITPSDLNITVRDTSRPEGTANPVFELDFSGFKYNDGPADIILPVASTVADISSPAGTYPITLTGGSAANYNLILNNGTLTVTGLQQIIVIADTTGILEGQSLPTFTYRIIGTLNPGDSVISPPQFTVQPSGYNTAGEYVITPSNIQITNQSSYNIGYVDGRLFVNPYGIFAFYVRARLSCVEPVSGHPSGMTWHATLRAINFNSTPVYVPRGPYNYIQGNYVGSIPEVFPPGHSYFDVYFDGNPIKWRLTTYSLYWQVTSTKTVNTNRIRPCKKAGFDLDNDSIEEGGFVIVDPGQMIPAEPQLFPNPTSGEVYIIPSTPDGNYSIRILETTGRVIREGLKPEQEGNLLRVDLSALGTGIYLLELRSSGKSHYFRVSKE